jgi:hypothetical protein
MRKFAIALVAAITAGATLPAAHKLVSMRNRVVSA